MNDWSLIRAHVEGAGEGAFSEVVRRHGGMVYATALRHVRDAHMAEDITQAVFLVLARRADHLSSGVVLGGWLYRTACLVSKRALRDEVRRLAREGSTSEMWNGNDSEDPNWTEIEPHLDPALNSLPDRDRDALLLRFMEKRSFREVGEALSLSEEAAKKRVQRALEKVRIFLQKRGVAVPTAALAAAWAGSATAALSQELLARCSGGNPSESVLRLAGSSLPNAWVARMKWAGALLGVGLVIWLSGERLRRSVPPAAPTVAPAAEAAAVLANSDPLPATAMVEKPGFIVRVLAAENDSPLAGAEVVVIDYGSSGRRAVLRTDAAGEARAETPSEFFGLAIIASATGRVPVRSSWGMHEALALPREYVIRLVEGGRLIGRVVNEEGLEVGGATIHINGPGIQWNSRESVTYATPASNPATDAQGYWESRFLAPGTRWIGGRVSHPDYADTTFSTNLAPGEVKQLLFTLEHGQSVSGTVRAAEGAPVAAASVELQDLSGWRRPRQAGTTAYGQFSFERTGSGEYRIRAVAKDFQSANVVLKVSAASTNLTIILAPSVRAGEAVLRGRVVTARGLPVGYAKVSLQPAGPDEPLHWSTDVDDDGRFEWLHAPDQLLTLRVSLGERKDQLFSITPDGTEHELRLEPERTLRLSGAVRDAATGSSIKGVKLMLRPIQDGGRGSENEWLGEAYEGRFTFIVDAAKFSIEHSAYSPESMVQLQIRTNAILLVEAAGYRKGTVTLPRQTNDIEVSVELEAGGVVSGIVLQPGGQPAAGAGVGFSTKATRAFMEAPGQFAESDDPEHGVATTGPDGRFQAEVNYDAERLLITHQAGWLIAPLPRQPNQEFHLLPWGQISGQVHLGGRPTPGAIVRAQAGSNESDSMSFSFQATADPEGNFRFEKLPGGKVELSLLNQRSTVGVFSHARLAEVRPGQTTQADLGGDGVRVVGRLVPSADGAAIDWARSAHHLQVDAVGGGLGRPGYGFFCEPDGTFEILDVMPGDYRLIARLEGVEIAVDRLGNRHRPMLGLLMTNVTVQAADTDLGALAVRP